MLICKINKGYNCKYTQVINYCCFYNVKGKTDRQKLLQMYEDGTKFEFTFSDDELGVGQLIGKADYDKARILLGTIAKILGFTEKERPSVKDNFFELGGDSLSMVQVIGRCADLGYFVRMTEFALSSNLAELIKTIRQQSDQNDTNVDFSASPSTLKLNELKQAVKGKNC